MDGFGGIEQNYRIVFRFFILCVSNLLVTKGDLASLAGVYTFSFLLVMALFGVSNLLLKVKREKLPRPERATTISVIIAIGFIAAAFWGNMRLNLPSFYVFIQYLIPTLLFILIMLNRPRIIRWLIYGVNLTSKPLQRSFKHTIRPYRALVKLNAQELVFFTRGDNVAVLNRFMMYVEDSEATKRLKIVHITNPESNNNHLKKDIEVLDRAYPDIDIDFVEIDGRFGPEIIDKVSKEWNIPKNFMFIGSPGNKFTYHVSELGGVRLIM